ncbi:MAG: hypothetical protein FJX95_05935 [Bacteroidetes bacterium]|nr:hypothetical protein [Bacteroidota bacterium]
MPKRKLEYGFGVDYIQNYHSDYLTGHALCWVPIGKKTTLNYSIRLGFPTNGGLFLRSSAGAFLGTTLLANADESSLTAVIGAFLLFIPEGIGYELGGKNLWHISINPLTVEYRYRAKPYLDYGNMACDITLRAKYKSNLFKSEYLSPFIAINKDYDNPKGYGLRAGYTITF